jgi:hypothetical protein
VDVETDGFNLNTVGLILFVVGAVGLALSLVFWSSRGGFSGYRDPGAGVPPEDGVYRERVRERERIL